MNETSNPLSQNQSRRTDRVVRATTRSKRSKSGAASELAAHFRRLEDELVSTRSEYNRVQVQLHTEQQSTAEAVRKAAALERQLAEAHRRLEALENAAPPKTAESRSAI